MTSALKKYQHYLLLIALLTILFIPLIIIGLDLGFVGDILGFEESFTQLGLRGGMSYTLLWDRRHLLSGQFYAVLHVLFPGQSAAWYGSSILTQFALAPFVFLFVNAVLKGQRRWLSFSAALIVVFYTRQTVSHFEIATGGHMKISLMLALLSLYCYLRFVRGNRQNFLWRDFSIACYLIGVLLYEASVLFFVINPLIAYIEEHDKSSFRLDWHWLGQLIKDSFWYPALFLLYFYLLNMLLPADPGGGRSTNLSPGRILQQINLGLAGEFSPSQILARVSPAFQGNWLILTILLSLGIGALIYWLWRSETAQQIAGDRRLALLVIGLAMIALNILGVAPTEHALDDPYHAPRLAAPSAVGIALVICAGLSLLLEHAPIRRALFAGIVGILVGVGITRLFQVQQDYVAQHNAIDEITTAIHQIVPAVNKDTPPYFLIIADAQHNDAIHSRDIRFPLFFDMIYKIKGSAADGVYSNVPASQSPPADQKGADYHGPDIIIEPDDIYSPLNPGVPIDRNRLVIIQYDSVTHTAKVDSELKPEDLANTNVIVRGDTPLVSNLSLIEH